MKTVQSLLPVFGLIAAARAWGTGWSNETTVYTTVTVETLTTYCPEATTFTQGTKTYTATASETLTITDCPCTLTKPVLPISTPTLAPTAPAIPTSNATISIPGPPVYVTTVVTAYTTYCPAATSVVQGNETYTVSSATTLTITNCPCTVSYPAVTTTTLVVSYLTTYCPAPTTITYSSSTYPVATSGTVTIPIVSVATVPGTPPTPTAAISSAAVYTTKPAESKTFKSSPSATRVPTGPSASSTAPITANGAGKVEGAFGALAVAGFVAMIL